MLMAENIRSFTSYNNWSDAIARCQTIVCLVLVTVDDCYHLFIVIIYLDQHYIYGMWKGFSPLNVHFSRIKWFLFSL